MPIHASGKDLFKHSSEFNSRVSKHFLKIMHNHKNAQINPGRVFSGYALITYGNYTDVEGCSQTPRKSFRDMGLWHRHLKILLKDWGHLPKALSNHLPKDNQSLRQYKFTPCAWIGQGNNRLGSWEEGCWVSEPPHSGLLSLWVDFPSHPSAYRAYNSTCLYFCQKQPPHKKLKCATDSLLRWESLSLSLGQTLIVRWKGLSAMTRDIRPCKFQT